jgi:hypothetical protein
MTLTGRGRMTRPLGPTLLAVFLLLPAGARGGEAKDDAKKKEAASLPKNDETASSAKQPKAGDEDKEKKPGKIRANAIKLFSEKKYGEALNLFKELYDLTKEPLDLYYTAACCEALGELERAYELYEKYLESDDKKKRKEAEETVAELKKKIKSLLTVRTDPPGAEVFLDGGETSIGTTPLTEEVETGSHSVVIKKKGYQEVDEEVTLPPGEEKSLGVALVKNAPPPPPPPPEKKKRPVEVPISLSLGLGATVSTSELVGSYIDASLLAAWRIREFSVGLGLDNLFFTDSYLLAAFPAGAYTLKVWRDLSMQFTVGFGAAYLHAFKRSDGTASGAHWDLVVHADARLRYKVGPIMVVAIPLCTEILVGAGSIKAAPLAQFAFLAGIGYDF